MSQPRKRIYNDLATRAGVVARRLLAERAVASLDDLDPAGAREVLRTAWREAAQDRFPGLDVTELHAEIDAMVDSRFMIPAASDPKPYPH